MSAANVLAEEIERAAVRHAQQAGLVVQVGEVVQKSPLIVELHGSDIKLSQDQLIVSQDLRRYMVDDGLELRDVVLVAKHFEEWRLVSVYSESKAPRTIESVTTGGSALTAHQHDQNAAANPWIINHNLGRLPASVEVYDTTGALVEADVTNPTLNQTVITFSGVMSGKVTYA